MNLKASGGWVFVSHSHNDINKVRYIRNKLEAMGFDPLLFYLKCLKDTDEIDDLIKREIDEREWFILIDSPNSRSSAWVQKEIKYIQTLSDKKVYTIDLSEDIDSQLEIITGNMKVFISCSRKDHEVKEKIKTALLEKEYLVLEEDNLSIAESWTGQISDWIDQAAEGGFILYLVSEASLKSRFCLDEVSRVTKMKGKLIPVYIGNANPSKLLKSNGLTKEERNNIHQIQNLLGNVAGIEISEKFTEVDKNKLLNHIKDMMDKRK